MEIIRKMLATRRADRQRDIERMAQERFQIAEYCGQLWLTFNGNNVCPCDMLKDEPVEAVTKIRDFFLKSHGT